MVMEIQITSRHHNKVSPSLHDSIVADLNRLEKFSEKITTCHVIIGSENLSETVEITMHAFGHTVVGMAKAENVGKALDEALDKIERQLKKISEKIKDHKHTQSTQSE
jgi:putative sigma-54 modulation protein